MKRIVLVRPAVEAGERLGFLPGDLAQKVDPYLRPLYDALYDLMGFDKAAKLLERGTIELAPLAYMRGRTLNHAFVILDEAQNTTPEQMKMFLTRIGFGAKAVVTGDVTQIDLARGQKSGLIEARRILAGVRGIAFTEFDRRRRRAPPAGGAHRRCLRARAKRAKRRPRSSVDGAARGARGARAAGCLRRRFALAGRARSRGEITVRIVGAAEGAASQRELQRRTTTPTNVLTFPYGGAARRRRAVPSGDRARGARSRARRCARTTRTWWCTACCTCAATTTSAGRDAARMERAEIRILRRLGFGDPYAS